MAVSEDQEMLDEIMKMVSELPPPRAGDYATLTVGPESAASLGIHHSLVGESLIFEMQDDGKWVFQGVLDEVVW